ncbi:MAG: peroxin [Cirrosporium novae-zelandiae]|nr:MAG: peroxin [Cirrosporium novae-zelandiae]
MISATRRWLRRNRTNFAIGFGVLGVGYVATQYVVSKFTEARERMSSDRIAKENLRRRFEQNQTDCTYTVLALLPTAAENILEALPVEQITHELQQKKAEKARGTTTTSEFAPSEISSGPPSAIDDDGRSLASFQSESYIHASQIQDSTAEPSQMKPRKSKVQLWNELKISSITRAFTLIYTLTLLTLLTRIQLNLLGRRNYLSSVVSLASRRPDDSTISLENHDDDNLEQAFGNDFETNRRYLTFSWWLLHRGWREIREQVEAAVKEVFGPRSPREDITLLRLSELTIEVRKRVEGVTEEERRSKKWLSFILPPRDQEDLVLQESGMSFSQPTGLDFPSQPHSSPASLRRLLDETSDLIDSPPFSHVLTLLLDSSFSVLVDQKLATQAFKLPPPTPAPSVSTPSAFEIDPFGSGPTDYRVSELPDSYVTEEERKVAKTKLANILAVMTRQAHAIGTDTPPNEYLQAIESVRDLEAFAAVVYSSNFEFESPGSNCGNGESYAFAPSSPDSGKSNDPSNKGKTTEMAVRGEESLISIPNIPVGGGECGTELEFENVWGKALKDHPSSTTGSDKGEGFR